MTSKELVLKTLAGTNNERAPRQLWVLPWATQHYPDEYNSICADYPADITGVGCTFATPPIMVQGDPCKIGTFIDDFGCKFENLQEGVIGEVKDPLVKDDEWEDSDNVHIPEEWFTFSVDEVNANRHKYAEDLFTMAGCCPRPFEQLQFIRGTENLYMDLMYRPSKMFAFIEKLDDFYTRLLTKWAQTDVDALQMMDDWGSQNALLINPKLWREIFKPMYRKYIDIAHKAGKKMFMHSDGNTLEIIPDLIDMGLDAFNTQLFCIGVDNLKPFKNKITFWGEIDRQNLLPYGSRTDIVNAVKKVHSTLYDHGGCIAQCEFGPGAKPENVRAVFETWDALTK